MARIDPPAVMHFGDYTVRRRERSLSRHGHRLRLHGQPFEILLALMDRPGEVVTREELQGILWKNDTFVDFENGLNAAIKKLRQTLSDSAELPRYVETVPRIGYRFIGEVFPELPIPQERTSKGTYATDGNVGAATGGQPAIVRSTDDAGPVVWLPATDETGTSAPKDTQRDSHKRPRVSGFAFWCVVGICAGLVFFAVLRPQIVALFLVSRTHRLTDKDTIVLADFANSTGNPVFDGTLRQGLAVQLEQSPFLSLVSEDRIQQTLRLMGQPADGRLTPEIAREICERTGGAAVLDGSIASLGSQYVLGLRAKDCRSGDVLDEEQVQAARKEDVLNALSHIASNFRTRVGESLSTFKSHDTPLAEATTPSLEALKAYSAGWQASFLSGSATSVPFFQRAIEIDPDFASAYAALGRMYGDIGESALSAKNIGKAYELRDRASDQEKFFISLNYDLQVTGNLEKAQQTCDLWVQAYPRAWFPHALLSGGVYPQLGKYEKSVEEAKIAIGVDPDFSIGYSLLAASYVALERTGEAEKILQRASDRRLDIPDFYVQRYIMAFLKDDKTGMEREAAQPREKPAVDDWMSNAEGFVSAYSGHLEEARKMSRRAANLAQKADRREVEALYETDAAVREALFGNVSTARQRAGEALKLSRSKDVQYATAFALALSGDSSRSQTLTDDLSTRFPEDTIVRFTQLPTLRALLALNRSQPANAVELLQTAIPYEGGVSIEGGSEYLLGVGSLYPTYVRGLAYLAAHRGREAAAEFQKILDHRGIVVSDPIGALAHLQLGRAYALAEDKTKARSAYQDFLTLWKDADPDIPILKEVQREYAGLQ
jgi:DNA-binding winged helix-turn-helix (wHTH) protein/tetratricopeptide (TPR) repeat protein